MLRNYDIIICSSKYSYVKKAWAKKKVVLFPEIGRVNFFLSLNRWHGRMCIRIYVFLIWKKKQTNKKTKKKQKKPKRISVENRTGYDDILREFAQSTFNPLMPGDNKKVTHT